MLWYELARAKADELGMRQEDIAEALGVTRGAVGHWFAGRREPDLGTLTRLITLLKIEEAVLHQGGMGRSIPIRIAEPNAEEFKGGLSDLVGVTKVTGASLSAGSGEVLWEIDEVQNSHAFRRDYLQRRRINPDRCKVWTVRGDSMEPRYSNGDVVLIDMGDRTPVHGKVFALVGDDGLRIKQLRRNQLGWEMYSFNPDQDKYPPEPIVGENYAVIGRVKWRGGDED